MLERSPAFVLVLVALSACTSSPYGLNHQLAIGEGGPQTWTPAALTPGFGLSPSNRTNTPAAAPGRPPPSVIALDRANWEVLRVPVPNALSAHQPIYTRDILENDTVDRNRGRYPTPASAHQISHPSSGDRQILEAFEAPVAALADIVLFLPRAVVTPPWATTRTGLEPYERGPRPRTSISPVLTATPRATTPRSRSSDPAAAPVRVPTGESFPVEVPPPSRVRPR